MANDHSGNLGVNASEIVSEIKNITNALEGLQKTANKPVDINLGNMREDLKSMSKLMSKTNDELVGMFNVLNKQNRSNYFTSQEEAVKELQKAFKDYSNDVNNTKAESKIMLWSRAYEAMYGSIEKVLPEVDKLQKSLWANNKKANGRSQYTVESFKDLFNVMKAMQDKGMDMSKFSKSIQVEMQNAIKEVQKSAKAKPIITEDMIMDSDAMKQRIKELEDYLEGFYKSHTTFKKNGDAEDFIYKKTEINSYIKALNELSSAYEEIDKYIPDHLYDLYDDMSTSGYNINISEKAEEGVKAFEELQKSIRKTLESQGQSEDVTRMEKIKEINEEISLELEKQAQTKKEIDDLYEKYEQWESKQKKKKDSVNFTEFDGLGDPGEHRGIYASPFDSDYEDLSTQLASSRIKSNELKASLRALTKEEEGSKQASNQVANAQQEIREEVEKTTEAIREQQSIANQNGLSLENKSLEELVELYHKLGTSNGSNEDLEKISSAILDIVQAENKLDASHMEKFAKVLKGLTFVDGDSPITKVPYTIEQAIKSMNKLRGIPNETPVSSNEKEIEKATVAIEEEGNAAKKSAEQKEEFVLANQKVAESGVETADGIKKAVDAIKEEGKVVSENKIDTSQFESMIEISDTLRERLGGVVDVYRQVQKDSEGNDKISYRLVGENGSAWVGANGDILKEQIKASEELTQQRKEEKEATRQAVEAERERQSLYKQMQKASSDKQSAQEKQRQSEINTLLSEQKNAYQKVWDIRKQIVKLDPDKNAEEISELEKQKQLALEIYAERTKELKSLDEIANSEAQNNTLLQMRQKALNEIAIIEAKLRDRGVVTDQPNPKDNTTEYTNLLARREIQQGNLDAAKIRNDQTAIKYSQERISALNNEIEALEKLGDIDKEVAEQNLKNEIARINASEKVAKAEDAQAKQRTVNLNRQSKMIKDFSLWLSKNGVAAKAYSNEIEIIFNQLQQQGELTAEQLNKVQTEINGIMATAAREGKTGVTFIETLQQRFKSLAAYLASFASFYDVVRYVKEGIDIVRQYDTALTEMRKVSDESLSTLKDYASTTFDVGDTVGATALTIQNSTADWMRLGEAINEAQESAKVSNILLNVSEFENIDDATTSLVAMSQAYKDIDKIDIIDKLNNIGNNFSISTDKLAQGLQNAAAVLQTQGNSIDESIALITAANSQVQDISKASGGIRTISLRISGTEEAKAELEDLGEDVEDYIVQTSSKTQETIKNFTAVASNMGKGIDVLDANGNLRNTYDILLDISKIYKEIQEEDKKAGTNRANALVEYLAGRFLPDIYGDIYIKNIFNCKVNLKLYATI